jgi:prepilin-type N-terminal cleavage/methylation domain-containing protein
VRQRGFTAIELILAVAIIAVFSAVLLSGYGAYIDQNQKDETRIRLKQTRLALTEAYRRQVLTVSGGPGGSATFSGTVLTNNTNLTAANVGLVQQFATLSPAVLAFDGFNQPMRFFASDELTQVVAGTTLRYRVIAVVAPGRNSVVDSAFNPVTGILTVARDDEGEIVNGYAIVREVYDDTLKRADRLANAYGTYFQTRYMADPSRNVSTNYFANRDPTGAVSANWDQTGTVATSLGVAANASDIGVQAALGLAPADLQTIFGQPIQIDNSSNDVNQPNNGTVARTFPPFSARVIVALPGGETLIRTVVGTYN